MAFAADYEILFDRLDDELRVCVSKEHGRISTPSQSDAALKLPQRPDATVLSESIPLFHIGRNKHGFWVAREADGRSGGLFLFKRSAIGFARKRSAPAGGCAIMILTEPFELDLENQGSPANLQRRTLRGRQKIGRGSIRQQ